MAKSAQCVRDVMTPDPVTVRASDSIVQAARAMRDNDIGPVIVLDDNGTACGIITDRDVVVRGLAEGADPQTMTVGELCSSELFTLTPDDPVDQAVELMRQKAVRRMPVLEGQTPVGIISLGDLALQQDPDSALGDISAAPPNR
jgi:CBS domain-containing protein